MSDSAASAYDDRDWHGFECAHGHRWWSAPTSNRCPVCGTTTYKPLAVHHGHITVLVPVKENEGGLVIEDGSGV